MVRTRRSANRIFGDDGLSLFGIRLEIRERHHSQVPNTKALKIAFLNDCQVMLPANVKANAVNDAMRAYLIPRLSDAQRRKAATIPAMHKLAFPPRNIIRKGTVVGYMPVSRIHKLQMDDSDVVVTMDLSKEDDWRRIPWGDNTVDELGKECGAHDYVDYGPECPRCFANLGIGVDAWARCSVCGLNEPGLMWSSRFSNLRSDVVYRPD